MENEKGAPEPPATSARRQRILLVDDEADILSSLKTLFEVSIVGIDVVTKESGPAALEFLKGNDVDLIITDFKMPQMDGLQFLAAARQAAPGVPRVLITAFPDLNVAVKAINEADIENFITKPLKPDQVVETVKKILKAHTQSLQRERSFARSLDLLRKRTKPPPEGSS